MASYGVMLWEYILNFQTNSKAMHQCFFLFSLTNQLSYWQKTKKIYIPSTLLALPLFCSYPLQYFGLELGYWWQKYINITYIPNTYMQQYPIHSIASLLLCAMLIAPTTNIVYPMTCKIGTWYDTSIHT